MPETHKSTNWNKISTVELEELVRFQLQALWDTDKHHELQKNHNRKISKLIPPLFIHGAPGVGKSEIIRNIARSYGIGYRDVRLAQREPIDIRGLPVPKDDGVHWYINAEWPRKKDSRGIIIFDELTAADRTLQVAAYEFILERRLGDLYSVPEGWYIVGAGNRTSDRAVATTMSSALANRFLHVEIEPNAESWIKWALRHNIHPSVTGFIRFKPDFLFNMEGNLERGWPSPRTWERVSTMLHLTEQNITEGQRILDISIEGLVGTGVGVEFNAYRKWSDKLTNVRELMLDPKKVMQIPERADQKHAICSAMVYHLWRGRDEQESQKLLDGFFRISLELPSDFAAMSIIDAMFGRDPALADTYSKKLIEHPLYKNWQKTHGTTLKRTLKSYEN